MISFPEARATARECTNRTHAGIFQEALGSAGKSPSL